MPYDGNPETNPEGVETMCKAMEDLRDQSFQRGLDRARAESIKSLMEKMKVNMQQAMELLDIPVGERPKYAEMI